MNILGNSLSEQKRKGFNHPSNQKGWTNSSYKPSRTLEEANYLGDEEYHDRLGVHNPLWRYIISRYSKESEAPLMVIGFDTLPLAIELSQWTYPINLVLKNEEEIKRAKSDAQRQAGFFKSISTSEAHSSNRVAIFIGIIDHMPDRDVREYIDFLLKGVKEVVCAVRPNRDWRSILGERVVDGISYYKGQYLLLRME